MPAGKAPADHLSQERLQSTKFIGNPEVMWAKRTDNEVEAGKICQQVKALAVKPEARFNL